MSRASFLSRHKSLLLKRSLVVATVTGQDPLRRQIQTAKKAGVDLIELRLDTFPFIHKPPAQVVHSSQKIISQLRTSFPKKLLLTLRSYKEAGRAIPPSQRMGDSIRFSILKELLPLCDVVDVEIRHQELAKKITMLAHKKKVDVIHSIHEFKSGKNLKTIEKWAGLSKSLRGDVFKVAVAVSSAEQLEDFLKWGQALKNQKKILMGMGKEGEVSRFISSSFGSVLTYGHLGHPTAPGQPSAQELSQWIGRYYR